MNKIIVVALTLTLLLTGCAPDLSSSYFNMYVGTGTQRDVYFYSSTTPYAIITDYNNTAYIPLLKDENIYGTWYINKSPAFQLNSDLTVLANNGDLGLFEGDMQWLYTNSLVIRHTKLNGQLLEEPFLQIMIFKKISVCEYEFTLFTFGVEQTGIAHKCELESS